MIRPLFSYILMAALRDRFFFSILGILVLVISLSVFFGGSVLTEQDQFTATFVAFGVRLFGVVTLVLFVVNHIRRSFEGRDVDYLLSRPMGRVGFILTHSAAFSCLAVLCAFLLGGAVFLIKGETGGTGSYLWWISLAAEFVIMANTAMFFAFVMTSQTACQTVIFAFYLLCRLIGEILGILQKAIDGTALSVLAKTMEVISVFIPRLDLMGQTKWLLYGVPPDISVPFVLAQCFVFVALIVSAAILDMHRRQF